MTTLKWSIEPTNWNRLKIVAVYYGTAIPYTEDDFIFLSQSERGVYSDALTG